MFKAGSLLVVLTLAFFSCFSPDVGRGPLRVDFDDEVSQEFRDILFQAASFEIVAIHPDWPTEESLADPESLHGYIVRGRATVQRRELRLELLESLAFGARENDGTIAACFNPRHALIAEFEGQTCELIICFECLTFQIWNGSELAEVVDLSETPRKTFDRVFTDAGLSLAPRH